MVVVNAMYFEGKWKQQFKEIDTEPEHFEGVHDYKIGMMHKKISKSSITMMK